MQAQDQQSQQNQEYTVHTVKWYEDLISIAKSYNVDPQEIINLNGLKSSALKARQQLKIPVKKAKDKLNEAENAVKDAAQQAAEYLDSTTTSWGEYLGQIISKIFNRETDTVNATLILPFSTSSGINGSNYDFYSGVLMAIRDFSEQGINTNLQVFDFQGSSSPASYSELSKSDIILGPLSTSNITAVLDDCAWSQYVISPLDSRAAALAEEGRHVIQAPSSTDSQFDEIISWIREDFPLPDTPVTQISSPSGKCTSIPFRLCSAAPRMTSSWPFPCRLTVGTGIFFCPLRYWPVTDSGQAHRSSTDPAQTTFPPLTPAPGPMSMTWSAARMVSSSCSTTTRVFPRSRRRYNVFNSFLGCTTKISNLKPISSGFTEEIHIAVLGYN